MRMKIDHPKVVQAINLYKQGKAVKPICKELHIDGETFRRFLIQENLLRTREQACRTGKLGSLFDDSLFDILTPDVMYWIGFLYGDGHIDKAPGNGISVTLAEKDKGHIEKFNTFLGGMMNIRDVTQTKGKNYAPGQKNFDGKYFRLAFSSVKIHSRLKDLGFTNTKTLVLQADPRLSSSRDFWRGVVDADGWVSKDSSHKGKYIYPNIGLSGTVDTLNSFLTFIKDSGIPVITQPHKDKRANVYKMDIKGGFADKILNLLYNNSTTYLDRKYQKYLELCTLETEVEVPQLILTT